MDASAQLFTEEELHALVGAIVEDELAALIVKLVEPETPEQLESRAQVAKALGHRSEIEDTRPRASSM